MVRGFGGALVEEQPWRLKDQSPPGLVATSRVQGLETWSISTTATASTVFFGCWSTQFCPWGRNITEQQLGGHKKNTVSFLNTFREGTIFRHHIFVDGKNPSILTFDLAFVFFGKWKKHVRVAGGWQKYELWTVPHVLYLCIPSQWLGPMGFGLSGFRKFIHSSCLRPKLGPPNM